MDDNAIYQPDRFWRPTNAVLGQKRCGLKITRSRKQGNQPHEARNCVFFMRYTRISVCSNAPGFLAFGCDKSKKKFEKVPIRPRVVRPKMNVCKLAKKKKKRSLVSHRSCTNSINSSHSRITMLVYFISRNLTASMSRCCARVIKYINCLCAKELLVKNCSTNDVSSAGRSENKP
jgi:hypothetical protein